MQVTRCPLPDGALLMRYADIEGGFTDCYTAGVRARVDLAGFVTAFYSTRLFKAERLVLKLAFRCPSTDADVRAMAAGDHDRFAIWTVEARAQDQILLCPKGGSTRSWLMARPEREGWTRLYFGSAVVPTQVNDTVRVPRGSLSRPALWAHDTYSRLLLRAACRRLNARARD